MRGELIAALSEKLDAVEEEEENGCSRQCDSYVMTSAWNSASWRMCCASTECTCVRLFSKEPSFKLQLPTEFLEAEGN
jgi:hypothetical protein